VCQFALLRSLTLLSRWRSAGEPAVGRLSAMCLTDSFRAAVLSAGYVKCTPTSQTDISQGGEADICFILRDQSSNLSPDSSESEKRLLTYHEADEDILKKGFEAFKGYMDILNLTVHAHDSHHTSHPGLCPKNVRLLLHCESAQSSRDG
jgi:hypothetical protein